MKCKICGEIPTYQCVICGELLCPVHIHFRTLCPSCLNPKLCKFRLRAASREDREFIDDLTVKFWGDSAQIMFDTTYIVKDAPAFVAVSQGKKIGFISYSASEQNSVIIVALAILPEFQGCGIGRRLVSAVEEKAQKLAKKEIRIVTSNDDLPALAFYQRLGYQMYEIVPNVIAEKHGKLIEGIGGIPIRDEIRLRKLVMPS